MSQNYSQLSQAQRYQIEALCQSGNSQREIASILGVSPSTICRELKRNVPKRGIGAGQYRAEQAQRKTILRHRNKPKVIKLDYQVKRYIIERLTQERLSPELIAVLGRKEFSDFVSHETIYKWIWACKQSKHKEDADYHDLYKYLAHGRRRKKRGNRRDNRGVIPNRVSIEKRPKAVDKRRRIGDLEVDLMVGKAHKGALLVITDRSTLLTHLNKLPGKEAGKVKQTICRRLGKMEKHIKTLTFDNDQAFAKHEQIGKRLTAKTFFTRPYTSQDKGTVENRIGLIRRFFPKGTDLNLVSRQEVARVERLINNRPIRKFNYKTANQVFSEKLRL
jgi:IS30 family transposase